MPSAPCLASTASRPSSDAASVAPASLPSSPCLGATGLASRQTSALRGLQRVRSSVAARSFEARGQARLEATARIASATARAASAFRRGARNPARIGGETELAVREWSLVAAVRAQGPASLPAASAWRSAVQVEVRSAATLAHRIQAGHRAKILGTRCPRFRPVVWDTALDPMVAAGDWTAEAAACQARADHITCWLASHPRLAGISSRGAPRPYLPARARIRTASPSRSMNAVACAEPGSRQ